MIGLLDSQEAITDESARRYTIGVDIGGTFTDLIERIRREVPYEDD